jgi:hypothetical protein
VRFPLGNTDSRKAVKDDLFAGAPILARSAADYQFVASESVRADQIADAPSGFQDAST